MGILVVVGLEPPPNVNRGSMFDYVKEPMLDVPNGERETPYYFENKRRRLK